MADPVDLRRLHVLRMVDAHGSVTAAATALHLTPSAVSHQVRQLSRELGVSLLEPDGRGIRLTAAGQRLVAHADDLHARWEHARGDLEALADGCVGVLRLCGFPTAVAGLLAPAAERLAVTAPEVDARIVEVDEPENGFDLLLAGDVDIALVTPTVASPPLDDGRFDQRPLLDEPLDLVVPTGHPLAESPPVPLRAAGEEPWVLAAPGGCYDLIASACAAAGFTPRVAHEAKSPLAVGALVARGLGVAVLPRLAPLPVSAAVTRVPLEGDPPPQRHIITAVRRGSAQQPAIAKGIEALHSVARALGPMIDHTADRTDVELASAG